MNVAKFNRFTDPLFLKQIGRPLLERFLLQFQPSLAGRSLLLPPSAAHDEEFFNLMAHLLMSPESLPDAMSEALHTINEMATPEGQQRIEQVIEEAGAGLSIEDESTCGDMAMQVWLSDPRLLARARNAHRIVRLRTFHHFACKEGWAARARSRTELESVAALEARCDLWFARHNRGRDNTRIELYILPSPGPESQGRGLREWWFLIRHGNTFSRTAKIERGRTEVLHFRPAKDDVVVFNPARSEIRINARSLGERDLYRAAFGEHIFRDADAFSERKKYTLEPLLSEGAGALDTRGVPGLCRAVLRGVELAVPGASAARITCKAGDVFDAVREGALPKTPGGVELTQAWFDLYFQSSPLPRPIQLRPPNTLRLSRHAEAEVVERWLAAQGFRTINREAPGTEASDSFAQ